MKKGFKGIFNNYSDNMPISEKILKDLQYLFIACVNFFRNGFKNKSLTVYPEYPSKKASIHKVGRNLGLNVTNKIKKGSVYSIYYENITHRNSIGKLEKLVGKNVILNKDSIDISKNFVDDVHQSVFGYSTIVDPLTHEGTVVKKSDINAVHDGQIISTPIVKKDDNYIYQLLIDNSVSESEVVDIRVPIINSLLDFVYYKHKTTEFRFTNTTFKSVMIPTDSVFSKEEEELINTFCDKMNLNYGELDILRDNASRKIYIIDVNNTPFGPPPNIDKEEGILAMQKLAKSFKERIV
jgi:hypothetical protein